MQSDDKSKIFINTIIITTSTVIEKVVFFAVNIIIARYLNLNQYGEYTTALAFASFFSLFTDMGVSDTLIREINYEKEKEQTLYNVILLKITLSLLIFIFFIVATVNTGYSVDIIYLIFIFGLVRFGDEYLRLYYTYYDACGYFLTSAIYRFLFSLSLLAAVAAVIIINGSNFEIALFRLFAVIIFLAVLTYKISRKRLLSYDLIYIKSFIKKIFPFASTFIYSVIISHGNLIILPLLHGALYAGIFQNAYIFITTLMFIPMSFGRVFIPYLYKHKNDDNTDRFQFAFEILSKCFVFISFYITVILYLYSDFIITGVFGEKYSASISTLKVITLSVPFLFNAGALMLTALDKQRLYSNILRYAALINVVLNIILGYYYLDKGTAAAMAVTFFMIFIISHLFIIFNSGLSVCSAAVYYLKGSAIFLLCWLVYHHIPFEYKIVSMAVISLIYFVLSLLLLLTKDDIRIGKEILGRKNTQDSMTS